MSRNSTDTHSSVGEIEHFSISRESFDSYRRSFDVSARSPVPNFDPPTRQSLDSARFPRTPRSAVHEHRISRDLPAADERFEDVGLNDDQKITVPPKKRGFFSKFGSEHDETQANGSGTSGTSRFLMPGRKRAQSGQGAELAPIQRPKSAQDGVPEEP